MAVSQAKISITLKLTRENYHLWSFQAKTVLKALELWDVVESAPNGNPDAETTKKLNQAMALLTTSLSEDVMRLIVKCPNVHTVWTTLESHFLKKSLE